MVRRLAQGESESDDCQKLGLHNSCCFHCAGRRHWTGTGPWPCSPLPSVSSSIQRGAALDGRPSSSAALASSNHRHLASVACRTLSTRRTKKHSLMPIRVRTAAWSPRLQHGKRLAETKPPPPAPPKVRTPAAPACSAPNGCRSGTAEEDFPHPPSGVAPPTGREPRPSQAAAQEAVRGVASHPSAAKRQRPAGSSRALDCDTATATRVARRHERYTLRAATAPLETKQRDPSQRRSPTREASESPRRNDGRDGGHGRLQPHSGSVPASTCGPARRHGNLQRGRGWPSPQPSRGGAGGGRMPAGPAALAPRAGTNVATSRSSPWPPTLTPPTRDAAAGPAY